MRHLLLLLLVFFPIHAQESAPASVNEPWGYHTIIDLKECEPELIRDSENIRWYVSILCDLLEMKAYGEPIIVHFGEDKRVAGYSLVQLIETSCISGHFANESNSAYIDIFSCKKYNVREAVRFTGMMFKAKSGTVRVIKRY